MYQHSGAQHYTIKNINPYITAKWCIGVALASRIHLEILEQIRSEVRHLYSTSEDTKIAILSEIWAIFYMCLKRFRYSDDPHGVELMYHPVEMIRRWQRFDGRWLEDCESLAAFVLTCLLALGRKARICVVAYEPMTNDAGQIVDWPYLHIFVECFVPVENKWVMVDPSMGFRGRTFVVA